MMPFVSSTEQFKAKIPFTQYSVRECDKRMEKPVEHCGAITCPNANVNANAGTGSLHAPSSVNANAIE